MVPTSTLSRSVQIGLRITGIWPNGPYKILLQFVWLIVMGIGQVLQYWYIMTHFSSDKLSDLVDGVSTTLPYTLLFLKLIIFWLNRRVFNDILTSISNDWIEFSTTKLNMSAMTSMARLSHRYSNFIMSIYSLAVLLYTPTTIDMGRRESGNSVDDAPRNLLIKMEFPFAFSQSPIYECVIFVQFLQLLAVASAISILDAFLITLIFHIGGQIDVVRQILGEISSKNGERGLSRSTVRSLIKRHERIITLSANVEKLFTYIALIQFITNTLIICCIGFVIIISLDIDHTFKILVKSAFFYIAITLEAFIFCFAGEYLSSKSQSISNAAYESLWYVLKPKDSRIMLLLMTRSQRQLKITIGKFMDLSLETFTTILKTSASYVSVLYAMY